MKQFHDPMWTEHAPIFCMKMDATGPHQQSLDLSGWGRFFEELLQFIQTASREVHNANQSFSEYVIERMQVSIVSATTFLEQMQSVTADDEHERDA